MRATSFKKHNNTKGTKENSEKLMNFKQTHGDNEDS